MLRRMFGTMVVLCLTIAIAVPAASITWGDLDDDEFPEVGALMIDFRVTDRPEYGLGVYCSGTLVHPRVFLTAGHCAEGLVEDGLTDEQGFPADEPSNVWVSFDPEPSVFDPPDDLERCPTCLDIVQVVNSPLYDWGPMSNPHDVAAVILAQPVAMPEPTAYEQFATMTLPVLDELDDLRKPRSRRNGDYREQFLVVGYGGSFVDAPPYDIEYLDLRQYAFSSYQNLLDAWLTVSQNQARDDEGTCYGDSGGPIARIGEGGQLTVVGVTSWGDTACAAMGRYYRIDTLESLEFIYSVIESIEPVEIPD